MSSEILIIIVLNNPIDNIINKIKYNKIVFTKYESEYNSYISLGGILNTIQFMKFNYFVFINETFDIDDTIDINSFLGKDEIIVQKSFEDNKDFYGWFIKKNLLFDFFNEIISKPKKIINDNVFICSNKIDNFITIKSNLKDGIVNKNDLFEIINGKIFLKDIGLDNNINYEDVYKKIYTNDLVYNVNIPFSSNLPDNLLIPKYYKKMKNIFHPFSNYFFYDGSFSFETKPLTLNKLNRGDKEIIYYDEKWQTPVITEKQTFLLLKKKILPDNYLAFPWATLIDEVNTKLYSNLAYIKNLRFECFTVCQHIFFRELLPLFKTIGIHTVFTPHLEVGDWYYEKKYGIKLLPYSLFPVCFNFENISIENKKYKYSFTGSYDNSVYLSDIREKIFRMDKNNENYIRQNDKWFYQDTVYNNGKVSSDEIYKNLLKNTEFSLCPSGSGPNSIRLYESMTSSIPVLLADELALSPFIDWDTLIIRMGENDLDKLDEYINLDKNIKNKMIETGYDIFNKYFHPDKMINQIYKSYYMKIEYDINFISDHLMKTMSPITIGWSGNSTSILEDKDGEIIYLNNTLDYNFKFVQLIYNKEIIVYFPSFIDQKQFDYRFYLSILITKKCNTNTYKFYYNKNNIEKHLEFCKKMGIFLLDEFDDKYKPINSVKLSDF